MEQLGDHAFDEIGTARINQSKYAIPIEEISPPFAPLRMGHPALLQHLPHLRANLVQPVILATLKLEQAASPPLQARIQS